MLLLTQLKNEVHVLHGHQNISYTGEAGLAKVTWDSAYVASTRVPLGLPTWVMRVAGTLSPHRVGRAEAAQETDQRYPLSREIQREDMRAELKCSVLSPRLVRGINHFFSLGEKGGGEEEGRTADPVLHHSRPGGELSTWKHQERAKRFSLIVTSAAKNKMWLKHWGAMGRPGMCWHVLP